MAHRPDQPPGPAGHPVLGNLREFAADTLGFATRLAREHGDVARFRWSAGRRIFSAARTP
jgi:hypothetical protein